MEDKKRHRVLKRHAAKQHRIEARRRWEARKEPEPVLDIDVARVSLEADDKDVKGFTRNATAWLSAALKRKTVEVS